MFSLPANCLPWTASSACALPRRQNLVAPALDDVRAERAAIALSVGLSWPPDRYTKARGRPSWQQLWERALQEHIMNHHELPQGIRLQRPAWWRPGEAIDRPLTHEELAYIKTPAAAPVEDEPSCSASKRRKIHVNPIARDWFLDMLDQWKPSGTGTCSGAVRGPASLPIGVFAGINPNTPLSLEAERATSRDHGRRSMLTPADTTH